MRPALQLIDSGALHLAPIVSHVLPLNEMEHGFDLATRGEGLKIVFVP